MNNVCEDSVSHGCSKSIGIGLFVSTGSNSEETVFRVNSVESAVLANSDPSNIVTYAPYLVTLLSEEFRRNEHSEVCLTASRGECSCNILCFAVRIFNAEDKHVFSHPAFLTSEVGGNSESKALFAEKNVSAVTAVYGCDVVVFGEVADVSLFFVDVSLCMETLDEVGVVSESIENVLTCSCHNKHVEYNVDRVCKFDTDLGEVRTNNTHGVGDNVHCSALHCTLVEGCELFFGFFETHPVVCGACIVLFLCADECSAFNSCYVVNCCSVEIAVGKLFLIKLFDFACRTSLFSESFCLSIIACNPNDFVRLCEFGHFFDPLVDILVVCHCVNLLV